ncbi:hypothetical protein Scep_000795 [Stephania cephalantha]|uniref:Calcium uniporter protein C-terminal domain-containing protein n=1 Tax=Stephania cephalantha TaxID=152367 RepID=A0AAP0LAI8_9MAGN
MAFRKTLAQRLIHITRTSSSSTGQSRFSLQSLRTLMPTALGRECLNAEEADEKGVFRRFLQKREIVQSAARPPEIASSVLIGDKLMETLKGMSVNRDRIRLDGLIPMKRTSDPLIDGISVDDAKKLLRISQMEMLKSKMRGVPRSIVSYSEFVQICVDNTSADQGREFAKMLDESGAVIVLGDSVFLRPEQVTKAIEGLIPLSVRTGPDDPRRKELEKMEKEKLVIDREAESLVRKELWAGLAFLVAQTVGFARLTFWELSWDVMEPVCFFVTSAYFMAGYGFFLRTSKDPSFEGFFESRFKAKQEQLMKDKKFDAERFEELKRAYYPLSFSASDPSLNSAPCSTFNCSCPHRALS